MSHTLVSALVVIAGGSADALAATQPPVVDPGLAYSTFLGGSKYDGSSGIAVDAHGNSYVTGTTVSPNYPTTPGAQDTSYNDDDEWGDVFVTKLDPAGALVYSTFLGGIGEDQGAGIAVDADGSAYITGDTDSPDFPTTAGAHDRSYNGDNDAFVTKLDSTGALVYSTYLGGRGSDESAVVAVDAHGSAYITGATYSRNYPTTAGARDASRNGGGDAFVTKLDPTGALAYSTYLGGNRDDFGSGIAVDTNGSAYVTGYTESPNFPTTAGAHDASHGGGEDAFVTKLSQSGSTLAYSTYLGGNRDDFGWGIAVDTNGSAYITGTTGSANYPTTAGAHDRSHNGGGRDAFATKLNATGSALAYSTYLGGTRRDGGGAIATDSGGYAYVTGSTESPRYPTTVGAHDTSRNGDSDAFVTKLNPMGTALAYSTYVGGTDFDGGEGIAIDALGDAYITGGSGSTDYPTTAGADTSHNGAWRDAFVTKLALRGTDSDAALNPPPVARSVAIPVRAAFRLPRGVAARRACAVKVSLQLRRGKTTLARKTVTPRRAGRACRVSTSFKVARTKLGDATTLRVRVSYRKTRALRARTWTVRVRVPPAAER